ncbi:MAG TPA: hypothetical protein VGH28_00695 [Polyangiaceae bacterium]
MTALTGLSYCSDQSSPCQGFCTSDATNGSPDVVEERYYGFVDALGFVAPDAGASDAPADVAEDAADE